MRPLSLGDRYLRDRVDLRAGERWNERLLGMITEADIFQLFWSWNSSQSPYVEREWRHALSLRRDTFIRPTYWEDPWPHPPELLHPIQFQRLPPREEQNRKVEAVTRTERFALQGGYGFLTDYGSYPEAQTRDRVARLAQTFGIKEFQFYDWFATYSKPTNGSSWPDPSKHEREIHLETILTYVDEIHRHGGRAWACVQAVGADEADLADPSAKIYPLLDRNGNWFGHPPEAPRFWTYFLNAEWADRMTGIWGLPVKNLGFDGIHWDTLGRRAGDYTAEVNGTHAFLRRAKGTLAALGLSQTLNFVDLAWWDPNLVVSGIVAFPYAEVWTMTSEQSYYVAMTDPALARMWGVMAFYPAVDKPEGWTDSKVMLARWSEAPKHRLMYLILGDDESRLVGPYFPDATPLSPSEKAKMAAKNLPVPWRL